MSSGDTLPVICPPTPPRAKSLELGIEAVIRSLDTSLHMEPKSTLATPPSSSPVHSQDPASGKSSQSGQKKIRFDVEPSCIPEVPCRDIGRAARSILKAIPPSKLQSSTKSILKPFDPSDVSQVTDTADGLSPHKFASFGTMLEYATSQLANSLSRPRIEGYKLLTDSLRVYKDIPEPSNFVQKLTLLEQFIRRDISAISPISNNPDTRLVLPALKLTFILLTLHVAASGAMSDDFVQWLAWDILRMLEANNTPKEIVKNQLLLLSADHFCGRVLTPDRVAQDRAARIMKAVLTVHRRVSGIAILGVRLSIYARFVDRQSQVMSASIRQWLPQLLHAVLSNNRDLQGRAVEFGLKAADIFGKSPLSTTVLNDFFDQASSDTPDQSNFDKFEAGIRSVLKDGSPKSKLDVPRIWSIVILFLRGKPRELQYWSRFPSWMLIIQQCFNKSNPDLVVKAFTAWNRFIIAVKPELTTRRSVSKGLFQPIVSHLIRPATSDRLRRTRDSAFSSYCFLLYYVFRPTATEEQLDRYWQECIVDLLDSVNEHSIRELPTLCSVLSAALYDSKSTFWNEERTRSSIAMPIRSKEVPRLSPLWVRKHVHKVLSIIERLFILNGHRQEGNLSPQLHVWECLLKTVVQAGEKEVLPSKESTKASVYIVEALVNILKSIDHQLLHAECASKKIVLTAWALAKISLATLGPSSFLTTASKRATTSAMSPTGEIVSGTQDLTDAPILRVLQELSKITARCDEVAETDVKDFLFACIVKSQSRRTKLRFLRTCALAIADSSIAASPASLTMGSAQLWSGMMASLQACLQDYVDHQRLSHDLQQEYNLALDILDLGLRVNNERVRKETCKALDRVVEVAQVEAGRDAANYAVYYPLLRRADQGGCLWTLPSCLRATALLLAYLQPNDRRTSEKVGSILFRFTGFTGGTEDGNWFQSLCSVTGRTLADAYIDYQVQHHNKLQLLLSETAVFARSDRNVHPNKFLYSIQDAVVMWIEDVKHTTANEALASVILTFWKDLLTVIEDVVERDSAMLRSLQDLYRAGLQSYSRDVAVASIEAWNRIAGLEVAINVPEELQQILVALQDIADVRLPTDMVQDNVRSSCLSLAPVAMTVISQTQVPDFVGEQERANYYTKMFPWYSATNDVASGLLSEARTPIFPRGHLFVHRDARSSPAQRNEDTSNVSRQKAPAKLRHNDSQVQFTTIESSPPPTIYDSQMLTEHQKEVAQRQQTERGLLARMGTTTSAPDTPRIGSNDEHQPQPALTNDGAHDEHTPQSSTRHVARLSPEQEVPSSPLHGVGRGAALEHKSQGPSAAPLGSTDAGSGAESDSGDERDQDAGQDQQAPESPILPTLLTTQTAAVEDEPPFSDVYLDAVADQISDGALAANNPIESPVQVPTSQVERMQEAGQLTSLDQIDPQNEQVELDLRRAEESFVTPMEMTAQMDIEERGVFHTVVAPRGLDPGDVDAVPIADEDQEAASAAIQTGPDPASHQQVSGPEGNRSPAVHETQHHAAAQNNMILALSHSPSRLETPRVCIPMSQQSDFSDYIIEDQDLGVDSTSQAKVKQVASKRKRSLRSSDYATKRARISEVRQESFETPNVLAPEQDEASPDSIVLGKAGPNTPSFYEVIREREASQSQKGSPPTKRSKRIPSQPPSQSSLRKRNFTAYTEEDDAEIEDQSNKGDTPNQDKRRRSCQTTPAPAAKRRGAKRVSSANSAPVSAAPNVRRKRGRPPKNSSEQALPSRDVSTEISQPKDQVQEQPPDDNDGEQVELRTSDFATSDDKDQMPPEPAAAPLEQSADPATPNRGKSNETQSSTPGSTMSQGSRIRSFKEKLQGLWTDAKRLVLGGSEHEEERRDLEDISFAFSREIVLAGRRKNVGHEEST